MNQKAKEKHGIFRKVTFKLTLLHLILFTTTSLIIFILIHLSLTSALRARTDRSLRDERREFESLYVKHGLKELQSEFTNEARSNGSGAWFYALLSPDHKILASSDLNPWKGIDLKPGFINTFHEGEEFFKTRRHPGSEHKVRILYKVFKGGNILQVGHSLRDNDEILEEVERILGYGFVAILMLGTLLGWLISRRAMSGVERVTEIATHIDRSELSRRVPAGSEGQEIEDLARAFNSMLDRIQSLVRDLKEVTNNVAHDLRSPLTRIRGMAENVLLAPTDPSEFRETAGMIIEECDQLLGMINTMLAIAQVDSGLSHLSKTTLDMREIIQELVDLFKPAAEDKGISVRSLLPSRPMKVLGDRAALQRALANLLDNAIKFSGRGDTVQVTLLRENSWLVIELRDTGMGINEKDLPHIFDRFYRGDQSRSKAGNGLGLSLALSLIQTHGGDIKVTSTIGKGSTFRIYLPHTPA